MRGVCGARCLMLTSVQQHRILVRVDKESGTASSTEKFTEIHSLPFADRIKNNYSCRDKCSLLKGLFDNFCDISFRRVGFLPRTRLDFSAAPKMGLSDFFRFRPGHRIKRDKNALHSLFMHLKTGNAGKAVFVRGYTCFPFHVRFPAFRL